jgi:5-methylcytosine-specific restriction protein B
MTEQKGNRFTRYFPLLLDALRASDPTPMRPADARAWIQSHTTVAEADLSRRIANKVQTIFENDVHWVRFYLAKAGLISSPKRGLWGLTPEGRRTHLTADSTWDLYVRVRDANRPGAADEDATPAPEADPDGEGIAYWFVGALWAGAEDQAERFRAEGTWVSEKLKDHILRMTPGDRIAIKAAFVKKLHVPFDVGGASVSCMRIKATGRITGNVGDGRTVTVDWDPPSPPRDWYFYTYRITLVEADPENEMALRLIEFAFEGASQDYDWWLKQPYWARQYSVKPGLTPPATEPETGDDADEVLVEGKGEGTVAPTYTVESIVADGAFVSAERLNEMLTRWRAKKNMILQGPPGTGKTFLAKRLGYALIGSRDRETTRFRLRVVQFHPSLAYEDFVRGWRPKGKEGLELVDGIFMQAMEAARSEPDSPFVLVIEEINRGNPAQIFGELLTLMEVAKRQRDEAIELAYRRTDGERVYVPPNLYVIGTMNIADRSLALVDLALRRRFAFVDLEPSLGPEWRGWCTARGMSTAVVDRVAERVAALNTKISEASSLGPQFRIGHSYVTPEEDEHVGDGRGWFLARVETEIAPLLEEYWYDAPETAKDARAALILGF